MTDYTCHKCNGTGIWPDGATLEQARANPLGQHSIEYAEENNQILLTPQAVSPLHYHPDGLPKCLYCHGKGNTKPPEPVKPEPKWEWVRVADQAKLVRKALGREFPGQKFYVQSDSFSGGASIDIRWMDGPTTKEVESVVNVYKGGGFDGSIDMGYSCSTWLLPDGSATWGKSPGTTGSMGMHEGYEYDKPHPDARLVAFHANYIHCNRDYSLEFVQRVAEELSNKTGWDIPRIDTQEWHPTRTGKSKGTSAYFAFEANELVPGSHEPLRDWYSRKLWQTSAYTKPEDKSKPQTPRQDNGNKGHVTPTASGKIEVRYDRDWTWLGLPGEPPESVQEAIRGLGFFFSKKRGQWFAKERLNAQDVISTIAAAVS